MILDVNISNKKYNQVARDEMNVFLYSKNVHKAELSEAIHIQELM